MSRWNPLSWRAWLKNLLAELGRRPPKTVFPQFRPQLEQLEERRVPSLYAVSDTATTPENTAVTMDVLANDFTDIGYGVTLSIGGGPANGTAAVVAGKIVYTPNTGFTGVDTFTYTDTDASPSSSSAIDTVSVTTDGGGGGLGGGGDWTLQSLDASGNGVVGIEGESLSATFATYASTIGPLSGINIEFGDGQTGGGTNVSLGGDNYALTASHVYANQGPYLYGVDFGGYGGATEDNAAGMAYIVPLTDRTGFESVSVVGFTTTGSGSNTGYYDGYYFSVNASDSIGYTLTEVETSLTQQYTVTDTGSASLGSTITGLEAPWVGESVGLTNATGAYAESTAENFYLNQDDNPNTGTLASSEEFTLSGGGAVNIPPVGTVTFEPQAGMANWEATTVAGFNDSQSSVWSETTAEGSTTQINTGTFVDGQTGGDNLGTFGFTDSRDDTFTVTTNSTNGPVATVETQYAEAALVLSREGDWGAASFTQTSGGSTDDDTYTQINSDAAGTETITGSHDNATTIATNGSILTGAFSWSSQGSNSLANVEVGNQLTDSFTVIVPLPETLASF